MSGIKVLGARSVLIENVVMFEVGNETTPAIAIINAPVQVHVVDCLVSNGGSIYSDAGDGSSIRGCTVIESAAAGIEVIGPTGGMLISHNTITSASVDGSYPGMIVDGDGNASRDIVVVGNHIDSQVDGMSITDIDGLVLADNVVRAFNRGIDLTDVNGSTITGNNVAGFDGIDIELSEHGIVLTDSSDNVVAGNVITEPGVGTDNTGDGIRLAGDSNRNHVHTNSVRPSQAANATRYGINISASTCDDNVVADNVLGSTAAYGTAAYNDAGTGTVTARDANGQFTW